MKRFFKTRTSSLLLTIAAVCFCLSPIVISRLHVASPSAPMLAEDENLRPLLAAVGGIVSGTPQRMGTIVIVTTNTFITNLNVLNEYVTNLTVISNAIFNGRVTFVTSNVVFNSNFVFQAITVSNIVQYYSVVLAGTNTTVINTTTNGTNFYAVSSTGGGGGSGVGGFTSGITNQNYAANLYVDLGQTNYALWVITNTSGPLNLLFTNLQTAVGFNFTVVIEGENIDGGTTASNMIVTVVWPPAGNVVAQWLGYQTNTWVTSNKVLAISGVLRRSNSVIISSRE